MSSAGQIVGGIVGAVVGFYAGGPQGAVMGAQIGMGVGGYIDPPKGPTINGPRLSDLSAQTSTYGSPIPRIYGTVATHGNVIWLQGNQLTERVKKQKQGAKGGGGGATVKTYSYYATFAVGLADTRTTGPIQGVRRIWVGGNLIYDAGSDDIGTIIASNQAAEGFRIYFGEDDQQPDPRIQADVGVANCPAYRGLAYIVFYDFPLKDYGNSLMAAQVKVEIAKEWDNPQFERVVSAPSGMVFGSAGADRDGLPFISSVDGTLVNVTFKKTASSPWKKSKSVGGIAVSAAPSYGDILPASGFGYITPCGYLGGRGLYAYVGTPSNGIRIGYDPIDFGSTYERIGVPIDSSIPAGEGISAVAISNNESSVLVVTDSNQWYELNPSGTILRSGVLGVGVTIVGRSRGGSRAYEVVSFDSDTGQVAYAFGASGGLVCFSEINGSTIELKATSTLSFYNFAYPAIYVKDGIVFVISGPDINVFAFVGAYGAAAQLNEVIESECLQSGLLSLGDIDVDGIDQEVRGYRIAQTGAIRGALEPLQGAWPFDVIQSGYKIKFVRRGGGPVATIGAVELDARQGGSAPGVQVTLANEMDTQLPRAVSLTYLDIGREYDLSEQSAERLNTDAVNLRSMEMPIVLSANDAAGMSEVLLYLYWLERRDLSFRLPPQYRGLEPADVITITGDWGQYEVRLTRINLESDGRLDCSAKFNAAAIYTPTAQGAEGEAPQQIVPLDGPSVYVLLDIPLLSDSYNEPGWPAAMAGYTQGWSGGVIYRSVDGGESWTDLQGFAAPVTMGYARDVLGSGRFDIVDATSSVLVDMLAGDLSSIDEAAQFSGGNMLAFGAPGRWEICSPRTVTLQSDGSLLLSDWLRGRFGTEWAADLHEAGDMLVLLNDPDLAWVGMETGSIGLAQSYRGITSGRMIDSDSSRSETYEAVNLRPLSPVSLKGHIHPVSLDWTLEWIRRGRVSPDWRNGVDVPVGETAEAYEIEIYNGPGFDVVKRTLSSSAASVSYTYAHQVADFGSYQSTVYVRVYQISSEVGRGLPLSGSVYCGVGPAPYVSSVQFSGTFAAGLDIQFRVGPALIGAHKTVSADASISGVASAMAGAVNASTSTSGYSAVATGAVVTVTGPPGAKPPVSVSISGASVLSSNFVQSAALAGPGSAYYAQYFVGNFITGQTEPIPSGTTFTLVFQRPVGNTVGTVSYTTTGTSTRSDVYSGLASQAVVQPGGSLYALGYRLGSSGGASGPFGYIIGQAGETGHQVSGGASSGQFNLNVSVQNPGSAPVAADRVQVVQYTVTGIPSVGEKFSVLLQGAAFEFTAATASANDVAAGLAAVVDAQADYAASSSGNVVTVSGVSASQSFTYSSQVLRSITATNL